MNREFILAGLCLFCFVSALVMRYRCDQKDAEIARLMATEDEELVRLRAEEERHRAINHENQKLIGHRATLIKVIGNRVSDINELKRKYSELQESYMEVVKLLVVKSNELINK